MSVLQRPPIRYRGGKSKLCKSIISLLPPHRTYVEVFCGACWVLLNKPRSKVEVINDWNRDLVNLLRCVREHAPEIARLLEGHVVSHDEFYRLKSLTPEYLTDVQRAVRYLYLLNYGYCGDADAYYYTPVRTQRPLPIPKLAELVGKAAARLSDVWIERDRYEWVIGRFDHAEAVFYLDPPYWGSEDSYGPGFERADYARLRDVLRGVEGKFLMTLNDHLTTRTMFGEFDIRPASHRTAAWGGEIFISNYTLPLIEEG